MHETKKKWFFLYFYKQKYILVNDGDYEEIHLIIWYTGKYFFAIFKNFHVI